MCCKPILSSLRYANQFIELTMALDSHNAALKQAFRTKIIVENLYFRTGLKKSLSFLCD